MWKHFWSVDFSPDLNDLFQIFCSGYSFDSSSSYKLPLLIYRFSLFERFRFRLISDWFSFLYFVFSLVMFFDILVIFQNMENVFVFYESAKKWIFIWFFAFVVHFFVVITVSHLFSFCKTECCIKWTTAVCARRKSWQF